MKKILSFTLAIIMVFSLFIFCGCNGDDNSSNSSVAKEVPMAGKWKVVSTDDEIEWMFNSQETLHITEVTSSGLRFTTVCKFTYDDNTSELEYIGLSDDVSFKGTAMIEDSIMNVKSADGSQVIVLQKIDS